MDDKVHTARQDDSGPGNRPASQPTAAFTFTLPTLFYLTTVYGISMYYGIGACALTSCVLLAWWAWFGQPPSNARRNLRTLIATLGLSALVLSALLPMATSIRGEYSNPTHCLNGIRQFGLAIANYESQKGHFPPAFIADETEKPMHSWRVLILPRIGQSDLYEKYDFNEPWDGPNNIKLLNQMPPIFRCPSHYHENKTTYKLITGPGTAFEGDKTTSYSDIEDGSSNTLLMVEDYANPVPWTKPDDLSIDDVLEIVRRSNRQSRKRCCAHEFDFHFKKTFVGTSAVLFDGRVFPLRTTSDVENIRAMCTSIGGEILSPDQLDSYRHEVYKPEACATLAVYIALLLLPGWVFWRRSRSLV